MGLLIFQYLVISSILVYHYPKPHMISQVHILVPLSYHFQHSTFLFILNQQTVVFNQLCYFCNWWTFGWIFMKLFYKRVPICMHFFLRRRNQKMPYPIIQQCILYIVINRKCCFLTLNNFGNVRPWCLNIYSIFRLVPDKSHGTLSGIFQAEL